MNPVYASTREAFDAGWILCQYDINTDQLIFAYYDERASFPVGKYATHDVEVNGFILQGMRWDELNAK